MLNFMNKIVYKYYSALERMSPSSKTFQICKFSKRHIENRIKHRYPLSQVST